MKPILSWRPNHAWLRSISCRSSNGSLGSQATSPATARGGGPAARRGGAVARRYARAAAARRAGRPRPSVARSRASNARPSPLRRPGGRPSRRCAAAPAVPPLHACAGGPWRPADGLLQPGGRGRQSTSSLPICWTAAHSSASQMSRKQRARAVAVVVEHAHLDELVRRAARRRSRAARRRQAVLADRHDRMQGMRAGAQLAPEGRHRGSIGRF